jgi:dihydroflavonol-4-reductase
MILVTGATGHIGNVLIRELLARGQPVRALLLPGEESTPLEGLEIDCVEGDVLDAEALRVALRGVDQVFHLAGIISIMPGMADVLQRVNVGGTQSILRACMEAGVRRLIYTSSIHAIAVPQEGQVIDESLPFDPGRAWGDYDRSKARATLEVQKAVGEGLDAVIVCPTGVIGPYDFRRSEMGQFILDCALPGPRLYVEGAYDFVDVRDVAVGHILAGERGRTGESYILSGTRLAVHRILSLVQEITGGRDPHWRIPLWLAHAVARVAPLYYRAAGKKPRFTPYSLHTITSNSAVSPAKARRELGYTSRPAGESIADTLRWFAERGALAPVVVPTGGTRLP